MREDQITGPLKPGKFKDITGQRFGMLVARRIVARSRRGPVWEFGCDCGGKTERISTLVVSGHTRSCGCLKSSHLADRNRSHGEATRGRPTKEYRAWAAMIRRCYDAGQKFYRNYGGRGITVCDRWRESFDAFLADMGRAPSGRHTVDREDNDKGYEPSNCRWATRIQQARNTRRNRLLTLNGETMTLGEWSARTGIHYVTLISRLDRLGWSLEKTLSTPARIKRSSGHSH